MSLARPWRPAAAKRAACQTCRGLISPKRRCGESLDVPLRSGRSRPMAYPATSPSRNALSWAWGRYLARRPYLAQSAGPIRTRRLKTPVFDGVARKGRPRAQPFRRGHRCRRIAQGLHPPPEWREYPQSPVFLGTDTGGGHQEIAGKALRRDADLLECSGRLIGDGLMRSLRHLIPEHRFGTGFAGQFGDDPGRRSFAQHQRSADRVQAFLQGAERLRQPPARRAAKGARVRRTAHLVQHLEANRRRGGLRGGVQGVMIGEAQIIAKPDDAGRGGFTGHRAIQLGNRALGPLWKCIATLSHPIRT